MAKAEPCRVITVLSAGRSGTSLLMQALGNLGMGLSEQLIPGRYENPDGFFEDVEIVEVHKQILQELGTKPLFPMPKDWLTSDPVQRARPTLRATLKARIEATDTIWGFKDPRTCGFLPLWLRIFNSEKVNPVFILAVRDPASVIGSFLRLYGATEELAELAWLTRTCDAIHHTAGDCSIVHYEDWFSRPNTLAKELLSYTGLNRYFKGDVGKALKGVVKPNLNRSSHEEYTVKNELVLRLYGVLKNCRGSQFDRELLLDTVNDCRRAMDGFKGWYMEAQKTIGQHESVVQKLRQKTELLESEREKVKESKQVADELKLTLKRKADDLSETQQRINALEKQLQSYSRVETEKHKTMEQEVIRLRREHEIRLKELKAQQEKFEAELKHGGTLERQVTELRNEYEQRLAISRTEQQQLLQAELESRKEFQLELDTLRKGYNERLNAALQERDALQAELEKSREIQRDQDAARKKDIARLDTLLNEVQALQAELHKRTALEQQLEQVQQEYADGRTAFEAEMQKLVLKNNDYLKQVKSLHDNSEGARIKVQALMESEQQNHQKLKNLRAELDTLNNRLAESEIEKQALNKKRRVLRAESDTFNKRLEESELEKQELGKKLREHQNEVDQLGYRLKEFEKENVRLHWAIASRQSELTHSIQELEVAAKTNEQLTANFERLTGRVEWLEQKNCALRNTLKSSVPMSRSGRLWRKIKTDPYQYFSDSRVFFIRPIRYLFKAG